MSQIRDRLQFFRQQMAAFEGSADPRRAIESGYYVEQPRNSLAESIAARVALRPSFTHLLVGSIGSGKTTQLLMTCDRLNEIEDISAHYVDVSSYTDIPVSLIKPGVLVAIAGIVLSELIKNSQTLAVKESMDKIKKYAYGYLEHKPISSQIDHQERPDNSAFTISPPASIYPPVYTETVEHEGVLNVKSEAYRRKQEILKSLQQLNEAASANFGKIIILFDGLDRFKNSQQFLNLITQDLQTLSKVGVGSILVGSPITTYVEQDNLAQLVSTVNYQSYFDVQHDPASYQFFKNILKKRSPGEFICPVAMDDLIYFSGGVLRDFINLTQSAIEEAYLSNSNELLQIHATTAASSFGKAKILGVSNPEIKILKEVLSTGNFIPRTNKDIQLIMTQRILEYQYPKIRYVVHPTIKPFIKEINIDL